jgi:hypothetical protein
MVDKNALWSQLGQYAPGYVTSPIAQAGLENWDPQGIQSSLAKTGYNLGVGVGKGKTLGAAAVGETGMYVPTIEEQAAEMVRAMGKDPDTNPFLYNTALKDLAPESWGKKFGHELGHLGFEYENPDNIFENIGKRIGDVPDWWLNKFGMNPTIEEGGDYDPYGGTYASREEKINHMHDLMYGNRGLDYLTDRGLYSLPTPVFGGQFGKRIGSTPGGWTKKGYNTIRNAGLVPWQQGVLMQGPTTAAGQISRYSYKDDDGTIVTRGQTPEQVKAQGQAYMDPNRGNVQAPTMTSSQIRQEADRTGGTRHAGEMTQAAAREAPQPSSYSNVRRYGRARGGIASLWQR